MKKMSEQPQIEATRMTAYANERCKIHGDFIVDCSFFGVYCPTCKFEEKDGRLQLRGEE